MHATSNGKAVLAALPADEIDAYIEAGLGLVTTRTIVDPAALRAELDTIAELGYRSDPI